MVFVARRNSLFSLRNQGSRAGSLQVISCSTSPILCFQCIMYFTSSALNLRQSHPAAKGSTYTWFGQVLAMFDQLCVAYLEQVALNLIMRHFGHTSENYVADACISTRILLFCFQGLNELGYHSENIPLGQAMLLPHSTGPEVLFFRDFWHEIF